MATPFFRGNYGSALGRVDTRPIIEAGRAQGQMLANLGGQIGNMIQQYGLNKQKREEATNQVESILELNPGYVTRLTQSGDETTDKKNQNTLDKLQKGELGLTALEGLAGKLALMEKQDLREQQEATRKLSERTALLNQLLSVENLKAAKGKNIYAEATRPKMIVDKLAEIDHRAKFRPLESIEKKLEIEKQQREGDVDKEVLDLEGGVRGVAQGIVDKKELEKERERLGVRKDKLDISEKKQKQKGGKYSTIDEVGKELERLAQQGTTARAVRNEFGGFDIANVQAVRKQNLTEFDPTNHPGIFADMNGGLFKLDKDGELVSIGGDKTAQREGQKLDYLRMRQKQINNNYLFYKQNGKLVDKNMFTPDSEPDEDTDPDDLHYFYKGEYVKYNQDEEDIINDIEILMEKIGAELNFDLDVTK